MVFVAGSTREYTMAAYLDALLVSLQIHNDDECNDEDNGDDPGSEVNP